MDIHQGGAHRRITQIAVVITVEEANQRLDEGWELFSTEPYVPNVTGQLPHVVAPPRLLFVMVKRGAPPPPDGPSPKTSDPDA